MKTTLPLLCLTVLFIACRQNTPVNQTPALAPGHTDSTGVSPQQKKINDSLTEIRDSITFEKILQTAMARALKHTEVHFTETFEDKSLTDSITTHVTIRGGNWFDKNKKHVIITRSFMAITCTNIFLVQNGKLVQQVYNETYALAYVNDSILETNGDGYNDFAVHSYPQSGCCLRDVYEVYLYRPKTGDFSAEYEFINPTFSPKEKVIRGLLYGHFPGRYKYKWNGTRVDTLEFIYKDTASTNKYYITRRMAEERPPEKESGIVKVVNGLPAEYENVPD